MSIPDFDTEEWQDMDAYSLDIEYDVGNLLAVVNCQNMGSDVGLDASPSIFSTATDEEISNEEDYENFSQVLEHTKKHFRVTIIKEKTVKIRKEESDLKKLRMEEEEHQMSNPGLVEVVDKHMVSNSHKNSNLSEPEDVLFESLAEERTCLHAHQKMGRSNVQAQTQRNAIVRKKQSYRAF